MIWADNIFNQMQGVLQNRLSTAMFMNHMEYNRSQLVLREVGKILLTHFNVDSLKESLAINLPRIGVKGAGFTCSIIMPMMRRFLIATWSLSIMTGNG